MPSDERTKYGWRGGRPPAHLHLRGLCGQIPEEAGRTATTAEAQAKKAR